MILSKCIEEWEPQLRSNSWVSELTITEVVTVLLEAEGEQALEYMFFNFVLIN